MFTSSFRSNGHIRVALRVIAIITILCFLPMALPGPVQAAVNRESQTSKDHRAQGFTPIDPHTLIGKLKLAYLNAIAARQARESKPTAPPPVSPGSQLTLLDEVGNLGRSVPAVQVNNWTAEFKTSHLTPERAALLHIWLGEYALGHDKDPLQALHQFEKARNIVHHSGELESLAAFDTGVALYWSGAYYDAAEAFTYLVKPTTDKSGYSWQNADLWLRHTEACVGYHNLRSAANIPEPTRLDRYCLVASMAVCLRALGLPYDKKTVVGAVRVTGEGSGLRDAIVGGPRLGVNVRAVGATDKGLVALPKPLIAYVEHDHFIAVTKADKSSVHYVCSDCGPWPGGDVTLTWKQWHMLDPSAYATVTKPGSVWDRAIAAVLTHNRSIGVQVASTGPLSVVIPLARAMQVLAGNVVRINNVYQICAYWYATHCCPQPCPVDSGGPNNNNQNNNHNKNPKGNQQAKNTGSSYGDPVNLATLEENYRPDPDITVYNPDGPSVTWQRFFDSLREQVSPTSPYEDNDFGTGWSSNYNVTVYDPSVDAIYPPIPQGATTTVAPYSGQNFGSGSAWNIFKGSGPPIASNSSPDGWNVVQSGSNFNITVPSSASLGVGYYAIYTITGHTYWIYFDVEPPGSGSGPMTLTGTKYLYEANGARIPFTASTMPTSSNPTVNCTVTQAGVPIQVQWNYDAAGPCGHYTITLQDRTKWVTTPVAYANHGGGIGPPIMFVTNGIFSLGQLVDRNGNAISFSYTPYVGTIYTELLTSITDVNSSITLLTVNRNSSHQITSVSDCYGRSVYYQPNSTLTYLLGQVSQIVQTGTASPPARYSYGYTGFGSLSSISVPSPTGTGSSTATINYSSQGFVSSLVDANGNSRNYISPNGMNATGVTVKNASGAIVYTYVASYDNNMDGTSYTDGNDTVISYSTFTDGNDPYRPSKIYDANSYYAAGLTDYSSQIPQGGNSTFQGTGKDSPSSGTWDIVNPSGTEIANSGTPNGWSVTITSGGGTVPDTFQVTAPSAATIGGYYELRTTSYSPTNSGYFSVISSGSSSIIGNSSALPWSYTWDTYGNLKTVSSPRHTTTSYTYSYANFPLGELTQIQQGTKSPITIAYYEPSGLPETATIPLPGTVGSNQTVQYAFNWDSLGNLTSLSTPAPNNTPGATVTTTFNYTSDPTYSYTQADAVGQPVTITDNLGKVTHLRYDSQANLTKIIDANSYETDISYDIANDELQDTFPATGQQGSGHSYLLNTYLYPGGPLTATTSYDESGTQVAEIVPGFGKEGELLSMAGSTEPFSISYDALYRPLSLKDGNSNVTSYSYNTAGDLIEVVYPGAGSNTIGSADTCSYPSYDVNGNPLKRIDGNNVETDYSFADPESYLTNIHYPGGQLFDVLATYDSYDRLSTEYDSFSSHSYSYDDLDNLLSDTTTFNGGPENQVIGYTFYPDGSRETMVSPAGTFSYAYDGDGRPSSLTNPFNENTGWTYQDNWWLSTQTLGNGATTTYTYNGLGEVTNLLNETGTGSTLSNFGSMAYDGVGDLATQTASLPAYAAFSGTTNYSYDAIANIGTREQLTQETSGRNGGYTNSFAYDGGSYTASTGAGNPTTFRSAPALYDSDNQIDGVSFDGNGNQTARDTSALSYDPENRLTSCGSSMAAGYNAFGLRAVKSVSSTATYYLYDGETPICEENVNGTVTATNTFGANGLVSRNTGGSSIFYTFDAQGNVAQRLDTNQNVLTSHLFDSFGAGTSSGTFTDPFGYGAQWGYYTDQETGLILCTHRYYDPTDGRWISRDPIGFVGGINLYGYVRNNPLAWADPSGYILPTWAWGIVVGGAAVLVVGLMVMELGDIREGNEAKHHYQQLQQQPNTAANLRPDVNNPNNPEKWLDKGMDNGWNDPDYVKDRAQHGERQQPSHPPVKYQSCPAGPPVIGGPGWNH